MENFKKINNSKNIKIEDSLLINVKSNTFGKLIYTNHKTGEKTVWSNAGDIQTLSFADLRAMKANQSSFFLNQRIIIEDTDDENVKAEDIYKALIVTKYYENLIDPTDFAKINSWTVSQIPNKVSKMTDSSKKNLVTALNEYIKEGKLDSVKKIKAFEEALQCELTQSE